MTRPTRIWTSVAHHGAFLCGGWASVRDSDGELHGLAGGERRTTPARMALAGLAAGLEGQPTGGIASPVRIETSSPALAAFSAILASLGAPTGPAPDEDLDLWARILTGSRGRTLQVVLTPARPDTAGAFLDAWAELAMDRAKARGLFATAIPRSNLSRMPRV